MKTIVPFSKSIDLNSHIAEITSISLEHEMHIEDDSIQGDFLISGDYKAHEISINKEPFSYRLPFSVELGDNIDINSVNFEIVDFNYELLENKRLNIAIEFSVDAMEKEMSVFEDDVRTAEANEIIDVEEILEESITDMPAPDVISDDFESDERNELAVDDISEVETKLEGEIELFKTPEESVSLEELLMNEPIREVAVEDTKIEITQEKDEEIKTYAKEEIVKEAEIRMDDESKKAIQDFAISNEDSYITYNIHIVRENETIEAIAQKYSIDIDFIKNYNNIDDIVIGDKILIPNETVE